MRLAIDASRTTVARVTGTENYALQMIRALIDLGALHDITLYFRDEPVQDSFPNSPRVTQRVIPFRRAWTHIRLAAELLRDQPDLLWVPAHTLPFVFPGRAAVTVHDLGYRYFPEAHPANQRRYLDLTTRTSSARASAILADSRATADDLMRFYGTSARKISVVYPGVDAPTIGDVTNVRVKYNLPERYFLFLGTLQPRKNIARIAAAYRQWQAAHPNDPAALVLAGARGWLFDPVWIEGLANVYMPGYVDDDDKGALYAGAIGLVFPSLYEGFGFPVLEAMLSSTAVICSSTSSLPELVGDAALSVDPLSIDAIADAMTKLSMDTGLRAALIERGKVQARRFTWATAARDALAALETAAR